MNSCALNTIGPYIPIMLKVIYFMVFKEIQLLCKDLEGLIHYKLSMGKRQSLKAMVFVMVIGAIWLFQKLWIGCFFIPLEIIH